MAVSVVDLRYVFGRSLVVFDESTLLFSSVCELKVFSILTVVPRRVFSNVLIIYRSLYSSDMCSCRACSPNSQYSTTTPV